ncbi:hypothetical protein KAU33_00115 [Candidatus Dependentiae bacterium]|nr:hypothetical protein [Candidatus Dependentiae bacterium]
MKKTAFVLFFIVCFLGILRTTYPDGLYSLFIKEYKIVQDQIIYTVGWVKKIKGPILDMIMVEVVVTKKEAKKLGVKGLDQRSSSEKIMIKYPKVVLIGSTKEEYKELTKTIKFFNKKGKVKKKIKLIILDEFVHLSPNKKIIGIRKFYTSDLTIYNQDGNVTGKFKVKPLNGIKLADDGSFIVYGSEIGVILGPGSINFYNSSGTLIKEIKKEKQFVIKAKYTPNNHFVLSIILNYLDSFAYLTCFDKEGNEKWRYKLVDLKTIGLRSKHYTYPFEQIEISEDSQKIVVRGYSVLKPCKKQWIFDIHGKLLETKEGW